MLAGPDVADAYLTACLAELKALKPGNVHVQADGHGMTVADFEASAHASAAIMGDPGLTVGQRILAAVKRTQDAVGCNTNLGIILLCAPLARAAMVDGGLLRVRLLGVLAGLTIADAADVFAAIRLARPGGLGSSARHDVTETPRVTLREAMAEAADRDRIAAQYAGDFADVFSVGLETLRNALMRGDDEAWAAGATYLAFLGQFPDTHIARKQGMACAERVQRDAQALAQKLQTILSRAEAVDLLMALDARLKSERINPGTSADLTVATLFLNRLLTTEGLQSS